MQRSRSGNSIDPAPHLAKSPSFKIFDIYGREFSRTLRNHRQPGAKIVQAAKSKLRVASGLPEHVVEHSAGQSKSDNPLAWMSPIRLNNDYGSQCRSSPRLAR